MLKKWGKPSTTRRNESMPTRTGKIYFSERRITIEGEETTYFVHPPRAHGYIHGDTVAYSVTRAGRDGKLAEARPQRLVKRTESEVIVELEIGKKGEKWSLLPIFGTLSIDVSGYEKGGKTGDLYIGRFTAGRRIALIRRFGNKSDVSILEDLILFRAGVRMKWLSDVTLADVEKPQMETRASEKTSEGPMKERSFQTLDREFGVTLLPQGLSLKSEIFPKVKVNGHLRYDFRSWFTMTIDGADAKDLDDAISIARYEGGDTLLGVHIADVAEYVKEGSPIDKEAYLRGTSIYTPGRVIPMLPEILSNDLCSLHPGEPKLTLSILMRIDKQGYVKESFVTEAVIESRHRGIYEEIEKRLTDDKGKKVNAKDVSLIARSSLCGTCFSKAIQIPESQSTGLSHFASLHSRRQEPVPPEILQNFQSLYRLLSARRKKEGKILFESTECYFDLDEERNVQNIRKRERGDAHMLIEEFMVLANEEVAKWCVKRHVPFLSRVHDAPSAEKTREIHDIVSAHTAESRDLNLESGTDIEPHHIRSILEHAKSDEELYRLSRLLLPKMAKAVYREKPVRHFGLALTHYAHFTSPIRRYPDLLLHRMIKYHLSNDVSKFDKKKYDKQMKKWGESLSEKERTAEDVSRAIDDLFMCRYMSDKVGQTFDGIISGLTESNIYVELSNGVEGAIYLRAPLTGGQGGSASTSSPSKGDGGRSRVRTPLQMSKEKLTLDLARGSLRNPKGGEVYRIGESIRVKITSVNIETRRIEMSEETGKK